jgi:hypothetical protein
VSPKVDHWEIDSNASNSIDFHQLETVDSVLYISTKLANENVGTTLNVTSLRSVATANITGNWSRRVILKRASEVRELD